MSETLRGPKIKPWHLDRIAIVYIRQSTPQQILEHKESTNRQYGLVERAVALGWPADRVLVIDEDQGLSGASAEGRLGFQRTLAEVALDHVGLILGLEVSRLARSCKDWHQLLELCSQFRTLLADADTVYDPTDYNDRLLLGLKGTMSEAELHLLKGRMYDGKLNKARRGELYHLPPIGSIKLPSGEFALDPDEQVQATVRLLFDEFDRQDTLHGLLRYLVHHQIQLPVRVRSGPRQGQLEWHRPNRATLSNLLHHPLYAGAYRYGHRAIDPRKKRPGRPATGKQVRAPEDCLVLIRDHVPAYISWDRFCANVRRLDANRTNKDKPGPPREGPSLLSGTAALRSLRAADAGSLQWAQEHDVLRLYEQHFLLRRAAVSEFVRPSLGRPGGGAAPGGSGACRPGGQPGRSDGRRARAGRTAQALAIAD